MDEREGDDALNMSTLKELRFTYLLLAKINRKDLNNCGLKRLRHKLSRFLSKITIKNVAK